MTKPQLASGLNKPAKSPFYLLLVFGSLMSKIILAFFVVIGSVVSMEYISLHYERIQGFIIVVIIVIWMIFGAIYEFKKSRKEVDIK